MNLEILHCINCDHINVLSKFTENKKNKLKISKCPICGSSSTNLRFLQTEKGNDFIHDIVLLIMHNFIVLTKDNMEDLSNIFHLTPEQEDSILVSLLQYGWRVITGGLELDNK